MTVKEISGRGGQLLRLFAFVAQNHFWKATLTMVFLRLSEALNADIVDLYF